MRKFTQSGSERRSWDAPFVAGLVIGGAVIVYGVYGLLDATTTTRALQIGAWVVGGDLVHDAVLAPIAVAVGLVGARLLPHRAWIAVRAGLFASACAVAVAYPMLRGFTRDTVPDNLSAAPLDYVSAVITVLVVVWTIVGGYLLGTRLLGTRLLGTRLLGTRLLARRGSRATTESASSTPSPPTIASSQAPRPSR